MARNDGAKADPLAQRVQAIVRGLSAQSKAKGERIDNAVRQLSALAEDIEAGIEGGEVANGA